MPELRVAHCAWSGVVGGAERALHLLVREQTADPELAPAVMYGRGGPYADRMRALGVPVLVLGRMSPRTLGRAVRFLRPYPVHHFHGPEPLLMLASLLCPGARRVYTQRGGAFDGRLAFKRRLRYAAVGLFLRRRFHAWSGNTAHGARAGAALFGLDPARVATTHNGLEFDLLEPARPAAEVREQLGLGAEEFVVGTAANLKDWKRVDRLVRAVAAPGMDGVRALVVGDGAERERLEALAGELGVAERVLFTGMQPHVGDFLQVMDAFALPSSDRESFGNAAVEAMAVGLPTVVFEDCGGVREHLRHDETGVVVAGQAAFEAALRRLRDEPRYASRIGAAARRHVRSTYTPAAAAARYRALYERALVS